MTKREAEFAIGGTTSPGRLAELVDSLREILGDDAGAVDGGLGRWRAGAGILTFRIAAEALDVGLAASACATAGTTVTVLAETDDGHELTHRAKGRDVQRCRATPGGDPLVSVGDLHSFGRYAGLTSAAIAERMARTRLDAVPDLVAVEDVPADPSGTFVARWLTGEVQAEAIDDAVDEWHRAGGRSAAGATTLEAFLGLSGPEYLLWMRHPALLHRMLAKHRKTVDDPQGQPDVTAQIGGVEAAVSAYAQATGQADDDEMVAGDLVCAIMHFLCSRGTDPNAAVASAAASFGAEEIDGTPDEAWPVTAEIAVRTRVPTGPDASKGIRLDWRPIGHPA